MIGRREFITLLGGAVAWPLAARAQQAGKLPTIGVMGATPSAESPRVAAFVQPLRELAWVDGRNLAIEYRWAEGPGPTGGFRLEFAPKIFRKRTLPKFLHTLVPIADRMSRR